MADVAALQIPGLVHVNLDLAAETTTNRTGDETSGRQDRRALVVIGNGVHNGLVAVDDREVKGFRIGDICRTSSHAGVTEDTGAIALLKLNI